MGFLLFLRWVELKDAEFAGIEGYLGIGVFIDFLFFRGFEINFL